MNALFSLIAGKLTSFKGEVSSFFQADLKDLESCDSNDNFSIFKRLERDLINTNNDFRIYQFDQKLYLNSKTKIEFSDISLNEEFNPLVCLGLKTNDEINFYEDYAVINQRYLRILSVQSFPTRCEINCHSGRNYILNIKKLTSKKSKFQMNMLRKIHYSSFFKGIKDIESENSYHEAEKLLEDITKSERALFDVEMFFIVYSNVKDELDNMTQELIHEFELSDGKLRIETRGLSYFFKSSIPGVSSSFKRSHIVPSDYLVNLISLHKDFLMEDGCSFTARSWKTIYLNLFDQIAFNYNMLITGPSGQGKSVLANKLLVHALAHDTKAVILDLGNSFLKTTKYFNGSLLSQKINPLMFRDAKYLKEFILSIIEEKLSKKDEGKLYELIKELLPSTNSLDELVIKLDVEFKGLKYCFSELNEFFTTDEIKLENLIYADFSIYPDNFKAPLIIYLIECFKRMDGKKLFIFDECWHLLTKNADYIAECFRTFRKHQASAIAISQSYEDFEQTTLGRVVIQNTYFKCLFKQTANLGLSSILGDFGSEMLGSISSAKGKYSEFLLKTDHHQKILRSYLSPLELVLFNTDKNEQNNFSFYMSEKGKYLKYKQAIHQYVSIKDSSWRYDDEMYL